MILLPPVDESKCGPDCPECKGNGSIGGDTESMWACTRWTVRIWCNIKRARAIMAYEKAG